MQGEKWCIIQKVGTVINDLSSKQEKLLLKAIQRVSESLFKRFPGISLEWEQNLKLVDVIKSLKLHFPHVSFASPLKTSAMKPDGGFLYIVSKEGNRFPVLITEKRIRGQMI